MTSTPQTSLPLDVWARIIRFLVRGETVDYYRGPQHIGHQDDLSRIMRLNSTFQAIATPLLYSNICTTNLPLLLGADAQMSASKVEYLSYTQSLVLLRFNRFEKPLYGRKELQRDLQRLLSSLPRGHLRTIAAISSNTESPSTDEMGLIPLSPLREAGVEAYCLSRPRVSPYPKARPASTAYHDRQRRHSPYDCTGVFILTTHITWNADYWILYSLHLQKGVLTRLYCHRPVSQSRNYNLKGVLALIDTWLTHSSLGEVQEDAPPVLEIYGMFGLRPEPEEVDEIEWAEMQLLKEYGIDISSRIRFLTMEEAPPCPSCRIGTVT